MFKQYRRKQIAELKQYIPGDGITGLLIIAELKPYIHGDGITGVSISVQDADNGSPKQGDMIARNPNNHDYQWLVAEKYFNDNFEPINN